MQELFDMHSHLDFANCYASIAEEAETLGIQAICSTVIPSSFVSAREKLAGTPAMRVSLGMHPWWLASGRVSEADIASFGNLVQQTQLIGEIGLDFNSRFKNSIERQVAAFDRLLKYIAESDGGKLITIHAVKSVTAVLDALERYNIFNGNAVMFHWFSGTQDEFGRTLAAGCYFSVGMRMMASERGRTYAQAIPDEMLLIESDSPPREGEDYSADTWHQELGNTVVSLAKLRETDTYHMNLKVLENSLTLVEQCVTQ